MDTVDDKAEEEITVVVDDDTPPEDQGRAPMPANLVEDLERDEELEDYSDNVKNRMKQLKKVWHDERREKEKVQRENQEAILYAQRMQGEVSRMRKDMSVGERYLIEGYNQTANMEVEAAKHAYKIAHEAGEPDAIANAQQQLSEATYKLQQVRSYQPTLQAEPQGVQQPQHIGQPAAAPTPDAKTKAWQERNSWFGTDSEMTGSAMGFHAKLIEQNGPQYVGTDEYWAKVDATIRHRFPEYFDDEQGSSSSHAQSTAPPTATVVAPATRSKGSSKGKIKRLNTTQQEVARKLGLTNEQYARELIKLENA
jgi:hypothetical protein